MREIYLESARVQAQCRQKWVQTVKLCQDMSIVLWYNWDEGHLHC